MICVLCKIVLDRVSLLTADGHGLFCQPCFLFFESYRRWLRSRYEHDKETGQLAWPWAYTVTALRLPPFREEEWEGK